jgi:hypothetical protein
MTEPTTPMPDTTPPQPGETTEELSPEEQPEGDRYDGGEIPPAEKPDDPESDPEPDE